MFENIRMKFFVFVTKLAGAVRSKTIWFNTLFVVFLEQLPTIVGNLAVSLPELQPYLGADLYQKATLALVIGNLYLRFRTKKPLEMK